MIVYETSWQILLTVCLIFIKWTHCGHGNMEIWTTFSFKLPWYVDHNQRWKNDNKNITNQPASSCGDSVPIFPCHIRHSLLQWVHQIRHPHQRDQDTILTLGVASGHCVCRLSKRKIDKNIFTLSTHLIASKIFF